MLYFIWKTNLFILLVFLLTESSIYCFPLEGLMLDWGVLLKVPVSGGGASVL